MCCKNNDKEIIDYLEKHGKIDISYVQEILEMSKKTEILAKHPYSIYEGKDKKWYTYLPDEKKGRGQRKRNTEEEIEEVVYHYWKEQEENPSIKEIYDEWINDKLSRKEITISTKNRYDRQYKQCMIEFGNRKIKTITECDIEDFILSAICQHSLTAKGFSNLRTLLFGIFKRAKKKKYINFSITEVISDMDISRKVFRRIHRSNEELVFSAEEQAKIIAYITQSEASIIDYGIVLMFKTGLRPGELAGLKKEDIHDNVFHVHRTEIRYKNDSGQTVYEVRDFPKTEAGIRDVIIPNSALWIIQKIISLNPEGIFLFERNGERIKTYCFSQRLETLCKRMGIVVKSPNKIRKTYASILIDNNVPESIIISQMGHTKIETTKTYYYRDRTNLNSRKERINNVVGL